VLRRLLTFIAPFAALLAFAAPAWGTIATGYPEWVRNNRLLETGSAAPVFAFGYTTFTSSNEFEPTPGSGVKEKELEIECTNVLFGSAVNEGSPVRAHFSVLEWWAMGHTPTGEHTEMSELCRFTYLGEAAGEAWVTAEQPLEETQQSGIVCINPAKKLEECEKSGETEEKTIIRTVHRPALTTPWNGEVVVKGGYPYLRLGIPTESGKSCSETPAPPGCIRLAILYPAINLQFPFEGSMEIKLVNGLANGLSPSTIEFEGTKSGDLVIPGTNGESVVYINGTIKLLGAEGRELITVR